MKISRAPDGTIEVSGLQSARADATGTLLDRQLGTHYVVPALTLSAAEFNRLVDLGVNMELQAPECVFIEG